MEPFSISVFEGVLSGVTLAALLGMWRMIRHFVKDQKEVNETQRAFIRSVQRSEIVRYFRIVVEQGNPITIEEMEHLDACYDAYHANGGNGPGTLLYEKIKQHVHLVTQADDEKKGEAQ